MQDFDNRESNGRSGEDKTSRPDDGDGQSGSDWDGKDTEDSSDDHDDRLSDDDDTIEGKRVCLPCLISQEFLLQCAGSLHIHNQLELWSKNEKRKSWVVAVGPKNLHWNTTLDCEALNLPTRSLWIYRTLGVHSYPRASIRSDHYCSCDQCRDRGRSFR